MQEHTRWVCSQWCQCLGDVQCFQGFQGSQGFSVSSGLSVSSVAQCFGVCQCFRVLSGSGASASCQCCGAVGVFSVFSVFSILAFSVCPVFQGSQSVLMLQIFSVFSVFSILKFSVCPVCCSVSVCCRFSVCSVFQSFTVWLGRRLGCERRSREDVPCSKKLPQHTHLDRVCRSLPRPLLWVTLGDSPVPECLNCVCVDCKHVVGIWSAEPVWFGLAAPSVRAWG